MFKVLRLNHGTVIIFRFDFGLWNWIYSVFVYGSHTPPRKQVEGFVCWFVGAFDLFFQQDREAVDIVMGSVLVYEECVGVAFFFFNYE